MDTNTARVPPSGCVTRPTDTSNSNNVLNSVQGQRDTSHVRVGTLHDQHIVIENALTAGNRAIKDLDLRKQAILSKLERLERIKVKRAEAIRLRSESIQRLKDVENVEPSEVTFGRILCDGPSNVIAKYCAGHDVVGVDNPVISLNRRDIRPQGGADNYTPHSVPAAAGGLYQERGRALPMSRVLTDRNGILRWVAADENTEEVITLQNRIEYY